MLQQAKQTNKNNKTNSNDGFWWLLNVIVLFMIVFSAFFMVYLKDVYRRDFINYQSLLSNSLSMQLQHNKLLLEESTWASDARIQKQATKQLNMVMPQSTEMIVAPENVINSADIKYEMQNE